MTQGCLSGENMGQSVHLCPIIRLTNKALLKFLLQKCIPKYGKMKRILA